MKFLVILAVAVAAAAAAENKYVPSDEASAPILKSDFSSHPDGHFTSSFETGNGIYSQAEGVVKNPNTENAALEIKGAVRYIDPNGTPVNYEYVSNEFGTAATGSHIPVAPPIPELIARALKYIQEHPAPVEHVVKKF